MGGGASKTTVTPAAKDADTIFEEADLNKDGKLSVAELIQLAAKYGEQVKAAWPNETIEATVAQHDTDKDGQLNKAEFKAALTALAKAGPDKEAARQSAKKEGATKTAAAKKKGAAKTTGSAQKKGASSKKVQPSPAPPPGARAPAGLVSSHLPCHVTVG